MNKSMASRSGRWVMALLVVLVLAVLLGWWLKPRAEPQVITTAVVRGDLEQTIEAVGTIKPVELVSVGAQVSGRIEQLAVALGDRVKKGDLIARIDSRTQQNELKDARQALQNAKASRAAQTAMLKLYQQQLERQQTLRTGGAGTAADYQQAVANVASTQAQIQALDATIAQRQINVDTAETNLGYTRVTAPMDGMVLAVVSKAGQTVNARQSAPTIVILGDVRTMTVYAQISEADVIHARAGQKVYFTLLGAPDKRYTSTLRKLAPAPESLVNEESATGAKSSGSDSQAIYYNGIFDVANPDGELRTDMTAKVSIILARQDNALLVPSSALTTASDGTTTVQVLAADGKQHSHAVKVLLDNGVRAALASGVEVGDRVVVGQAMAPAGGAGSRPRMRHPG